MITRRMRILLGRYGAKYHAQKAQYSAEFERNPRRNPVHN